MARWMTCNTGESSCGWVANRCRNGMGNDTTHWRTGTRQGTWITFEMWNGYIQLHQKGFTPSIESLCDGQLAGGLYGGSIGGTFFGESMFAHQTDASQVAFVAFVERLRDRGFDRMDCQVPTGHLASFGARRHSTRGIPRTTQTVS